MAERPDFYDLIAQNRRRTWVLMFSFFALLALVGIAVSIIVGGGLIGVIFAVTISFGISFSSYFSSASIALTATRAKPAAREEFGRLHNLVEEVSIAAGVPKPGVYVVHDPSPNAFATGRNPNNAAVAVTEGLLQAMNWEQVRGVLAHELAHIRNRDILIGSVAAAIGMGITFAARMVMWGALLGGNNRDRNPIGELAFALLAPIAAMLIQAAVSRSREFQADESAARLLGTGEPLAQALQQLESYANRIPAAVDPNQASNYIIDPLKAQARGGQGGGFGKLFSTHPSTDDRIARLRSLNL